MAVVSENGKDVYAVAILLGLSSGSLDLELVTTMVEAVSQEEAFGVACRLGEDLVRRSPSVSSVKAVRASRSEVFDPNVHELHINLAERR